MKHLQRLMQRSTRLVQTPDGLIWQIKRVNMVELAQHGLAMDVNSAMAMDALVEVLAEEGVGPSADVLAQLQEQIAGLSEDERSKHDEKIAAQQAHDTLMAAKRTLNMARAVLKRGDPTEIRQAAEAVVAFVCAGVCGVYDPAPGEIEEGATLVTSEGEAEDLAAKRDEAWRAECEAVGHEVPRYPAVVLVQPEPCQIVADEKLEDPAQGRVHVRHLPIQVQRQLAEAVKELSTDASPEVLSTFRAGRGPVRVAGRSGDPVRAETERHADR